MFDPLSTMLRLLTPCKQEALVHSTCIHVGHNVDEFGLSTGIAQQLRIDAMWRTLTKKPVGDVKDDKAWDAVREAHIIVDEVFVKFMLPEFLIKLPKLWMLLKISKLLKKIMKLLKKLPKLS